MKKYIPLFLKLFLKKSKENIYVIIYRCRIPFLIYRIRKRKGEIKVVFFVMNLSMWKYGKLYELLQCHPRFRPIIVLSPRTNGTKQQREEDLFQMKVYFKNRGYEFIDEYDCIANRGTRIRKDIKPSLVFYTQPYGTEIKEHNPMSFFNSLICYAPYCFWTYDDSIGYNELVHKLAWRLFYPTEIHKENALKYSIIGDTNVVVTGYPLADNFLSVVFEDPWKIEDRMIKRVIWAPHYSVANINGILQSNFLELADFMLELAMKYRTKIQIAFKPHPILMTTLYNVDGWGKVRTDEYYKKWDDLENGLFVSGDYISLFRTSDAMIHDSDSFLVEYHYTGKPVMFLCNDYNDFKKKRCRFGKMALDMHYIGVSRDEIEDFIENVVLDGKDVKIEQRMLFASQYLYPVEYQNVAQNMLNEITAPLLG